MIDCMFERVHLPSSKSKGQNCLLGSPTAGSKAIRARLLPRPAKSAESSRRRPRSCRITAGAATDGDGRGMLQRRESTALAAQELAGHDLCSGINYIYTPVPLNTPFI